MRVRVRVRDGVRFSRVGAQRLRASGQVREPPHKVLLVRVRVGVRVEVGVGVGVGIGVGIGLGLELGIG